MHIGLGIRMSGNRGAGGGFSPNVLFASGEAGDWFDPSDLSRMYTDFSGATPVTADGQTVFSIFGQRQGAMTEVVGDPSFDDPAYWTNESTGDATAVVSGGQAVLTGNTGLATLSRPNLLTVGRVYEVVVTGTASGQFYIHNLGNSVLTLGVVYHLTARSTKLEFRVASANTATITDISIKEYAFTELRQSDAAKRPVYAFAPVTGRRNLLTKTEQFDDAAWSNAAATVNVTANATTAPDGSVTADKLVPAAASGFQVKRQSHSISSGAATFSVYAKEGDAGVRLELFVANVANAGAIFNLATGAAVATAAGTTVNVSDEDALGFRRYSITFTATAGIGIFDVRVTESSSRDASMTGDGVKGFFVWGAQLELGSTATAYQKVNTAFGVTEAGVPTIHWLQFDGTNDAFESASTLNLSGTDKVTVCAGVRKLSDAAYGAVIEHSANVDANAGGLAVLGANAPGFYYQTGVTSNRTVGTSTANVSAAPFTYVSTSLFDRALETVSEIQYRHNGSASSSAGLSVNGATASGNFGAFRFYVGARNQTSFYFNGDIYFLLIRGALTSGADLTALEGFAAAKTGVTL